MLTFAQFYPISPDFCPCSHKVIVDVFESLDTKDVKEIISFIEDVKCKDLIAKIFKKPRKSKNSTGRSTQTANLTTIFRCLQEFLFLTGQTGIAEEISSCKVYRQLLQFLSTQVNDADFSFTSLEEDEFYPSHEEAEAAPTEEAFLEDFSSSDVSFI